MRWLLALPCPQIPGIKFPQFRLRLFALPVPCSEITCLGGERFLPHKQRRRGRLYQVTGQQDEFWASGSDYANFGEQQGGIGICGTKPQNSVGRLSLAATVHVDIRSTVPRLIQFSGFTQYSPGSASSFSLLFGSLACSVIYTLGRPKRCLRLP